MGLNDLTYSRQEGALIGTVLSVADDAGALGDLLGLDVIGLKSPAFASLGATASPFMTVGLDVLGRGRTVLSVGADAVYLTPGDAPGGMWNSEGPIVQ